MVYNATMIFVETKLFTSRILDAMSDDEYAALQDHLSRHPDVGALIPGAGGVRKVRWAGSGRGKRGGFAALVLPNVVRLTRIVPKWYITRIGRRRGREDHRQAGH